MIPIYYILILYLLAAFPIYLYKIKQNEISRIELLSKSIVFIMAIVTIIWNGCFRKEPIMVDSTLFFVSILFILVYVISSIFNKKEKETE